MVCADFQGWWWSVLTCTVLYSAMLCGAVCPAGIKEVGGATIVYRTRHLRDASSWRYDGLLCTGDGQTGVHLCVCVPTWQHFQAFLGEAALCRVFGVV